MWSSSDGVGELDLIDQVGSMTNKNYILMEISSHKLLIETMAAYMS